MDEEKKEKLGELGHRAYEQAKKGRSYSETLDEINSFIYQLANISVESIQMIKSFNTDLIKNT